MSFIRQLIERKISNMTGATVMFGEFKFSPMSGTIEVINARVAAERFVPPFLSIERIEAHVAVAKALRGEIVVRNLVIDRPVFIYNIHADGKTNVSQKPQKPAESLVPKEGSASAPWEFNSEKIELNHGRIEFRDATRDNYKLSIDGINGTLTPEGHDLALALTADSVARRDRVVELGTLKILGKLMGGGFRDPLSSSLSLRASVADSLVMQVTSTMIINRSFEIEIAGLIKVAVLMGMLPLSPAQIWTIDGKENVDMRAKLTFDWGKSFRVHNLEIKAAEFNMHRTFGHHIGE
ncbi:MAG TPA: hypothetical protein VHS31_01095 [Tepidisphaeraceae bacterium]|jgi:hypothetical protein|nr:hypothetical protein [Tepidisphaeraceae bacterium]